MQILINTYSLIALGVLIILIMGLIIGQVFGRYPGVATVTIGLVTLIAFFFAGHTSNQGISTNDDFDNMLTAGTPTVVELYSNF